MRNTLLSLLATTLLVTPGLLAFSSTHLSSMEEEIKHKHFDCVEQKLSKRNISVEELDSLLRYAIDQDDAEMVRLLIINGARLDYKLNGVYPHQHARNNNKIHAQAEIIVITS